MTAENDNNDKAAEARSPLGRWTRDLTELARKGQMRPALLREAEVGQALGALKQRQSVLFVGPSGAGKTSAVSALAEAVARDGGRLVAVSTTSLMTGTKWLGEWQTKVETLVAELRRTDAILYVSDLWNLGTTGSSSVASTSVVDALKSYLESREIRLVGEVTPELLPSMVQIPGFLTLFQEVAVRPLEPEPAREVVRRVAAASGEPVEPTALPALIDLTTRFWPQQPQPGPALELFDRVRSYRAEKRSVGEEEPLDDRFVEKVFSIYSGLPRFLLSRAETRPVGEIRRWFQERIVGQIEAIDAIVEMIALFKAGLHDPQRPVGTFLFVGPTGVGKTELARALAAYLFGSPTRMLRIDMSEFKDYNAFEMLVGDPKDPRRPARLIDPVRTQPFQVILLDEIEKAHPNVWDLLLQVLDDGRLTPPAGQVVDFRNTIVIATSNAGAQAGARALGFGAEARAPDRVRHELEAVFRPELLNRFHHIVVFHPLSREDVRRIADRELAKILKRDGITGRNLLVEVDDRAMDLVIDRGFDPRWGARALKRELQRRVVMPVAVTLMERTVFPGALLRVVRQGDDGDHLQVRVVETEAAREARRASEPAVTAGGRRDRASLRAEAAEAQAALAALAQDLDEPGQRALHERLLERRREHGYYSDPIAVAAALRELDGVAERLVRLDRLRDHQAEIERDAAAADTHDRLQRLAGLLERFGHALAAARRELVRLGPDGAWDAMLEIYPLGADGRRVRDLLHETYAGWARHRGCQSDVVFEPLEDAEPIMLTIAGPYAFGYLQREAGLHRLRDGERRSVARVRVAAWSDAERAPGFGPHAALKSTGQLGGRVRSRVSSTEGLVLQNARTLGENRELLGQLLGSWLTTAPDGDAIVRRYDLGPWLIRDAASGWQSGRSDALRPGLFHELLCRRVDAAAAG